MNNILFGDCRETLKSLESGSIQTCVTSPPYFGLRSYLPAGHADKHMEIGAEKTPDEFIASLVEVFREVRRVLADDGTCWLNCGDSYSSGVANMPDLVQRELEKGIFFYGSADPRGCAAESINVLIYDKSSPDFIFEPFLAAKRVSVKQGNNDFCEVGRPFDTPVLNWITSSIKFAVPQDPSDGVMNITKNFGIIIATGDLYSDSALRNRITALVFDSVPVKNRKTPFSIKVSTEPITKSIPSGVKIFDTFTINTLSESLPDINSINKAVPLLNRTKFTPGHCGDFFVREAGSEKLILTLKSGTDLCFLSVGHLFSFIVGLCPYSNILDKAKRLWNTQRAKQELGVPEMLKRALMEDGWICRQTIIWSKPNPMPESVTDRCTKSHEQIFLLSKSQRYYFDNEAIKEDAIKGAAGSFFNSGKTAGHQKGSSNKERLEDARRNKRSVWEVATQPYSGAHLATFPAALIEPCILAGSRPGDIVLDPFFGSGTTGMVAESLGRKWIGCELNKEYEELQNVRTAQIGMELFA